jgi:hypothetical protein
MARLVSVCAAARQDERSHVLTPAEGRLLKNGGHIKKRQHLLGHGVGPLKCGWVCSLLHNLGLVAALPAIARINSLCGLA